MRLKFKEDKKIKHIEHIRAVTYNTANEFAVQLVMEISKNYNIPLEKVFSVFDTLNYWNVINDDEVCCALAHDGVKEVIQNIGGNFNDILSRND